METKLTNLLESNKISNSKYSYAVNYPIDKHNNVLIDKSFFFLLVINGTAILSDSYKSHRLVKDDFAAVTPSMSCKLQATSRDFRLSCLHIVPEYFDSLPEGQPLYGQLSAFTGSQILPIANAGKEKSKCLQICYTLFSETTGHYIYEAGMARHLCSLFLLLATEILHTANKDTPIGIKRSHEIFRNFKKLVVENYRQHHNIGFYAGSLHVTTTYLSRIVKRTTGNTVCSHIAELICSDARNLLDCTDKGIKEIATELGFSDQSVFGKFFVRNAGMSPMKYRQRKK